MGQLSFSNDEASKTTLAPLPAGWASGLLGVGIVGTISFASATTLFLYMTYALIGRQMCSRKASQRAEQTNNHDNKTPDLSLGLDVKYLVASHSSRNGSNTDIDQLFSDSAARSRAQSPQQVQASQSELVERRPTNPFLILIYNLLVADAISALEFMLCLAWVAEDGIFVPSAACTLQALAAVTGAFSPAVFLTVIALHTYLVVVWGCQIRRSAITLSLCLAWGVIIAIPMLALAISRNGADHGGWYVRGDTWCSASDNYETLKFWTEYVPVMVCLASTVVLYALIGLSLLRDRRSARHMPASSTCSESRKELSGHHPAFFVYPIIYLATMAPLGICRVLMMAGRELHEKYYFVSAAIIAAQGLLNCLLWTTTIFFMSREEIEKIGLDDFIRTPDDRVFGNIVYIQGGNKAEEPREATLSDRSHRGFIRVASVLGDDRDRSRSRRGKMQRSTSQLSLRNRGAEPQGGIQMETITTIIVEDGK